MSFYNQARGRRAPIPEPDRVRFGKPVAAVAADEEDREVVADQLAAVVGEDQRVPDQGAGIIGCFWRRAT